MKSDLEERIQRIEERNSRVENDKDWEVSWTRRLTLTTLTYVAVVIYLQFVVHVDPWINALVPVIGFWLSTLSLSFVKKRWIIRRRKK